MNQLLNRRFGVFYRIVDVLLIVFSLHLSYLLRTTIELGKSTIPEAVQIPPILFPIAVIVWQVAFAVFRVYRVTHRNLRALTVRRLIQGHMVATLAFWGVLYLGYRDFSRLQTLYFVGVLFMGMVGYRMVWHLIRLVFGISILQRRNVLIVGVSEYAHELGRIITDYTSIDLKLIGFIPHKDEAHSSPDDNILGTLEDIAEIVRRHAIDEVIVCDKSHSHGYLQQISHQLANMPVNVRITPNYSELAYFYVGVEDFAGVPLISLRYDVLTAEQRFVKRIFDLIGASLLLILTLPLIIAIYIAIRLDSPGPAVFHQMRVGERGKLFTMYKFRTMVWNAESRITYSQNYKQADDPRVTRVGRWLRRVSLDEIPQFWNVLKGDMSLVGPRPELPQVVELYSPWQRKRFEVPQGMTGWWQINGRADLPMYQHVDYDVFYIRNYSVWLDLQILARTPIAVIRGRGAF
jgi:exopolysaccharide biosynthesis polyprenyl glycosylphosphotransferase